MDYASIFKGINIQCYKMELGTFTEYPYLIICCLCELCPQKTYEQTEAVFVKNEIFPRIEKQSIKSLQTRQKSSPTSLSQFLDIRISHLPASGSQSSDIRVSGNFSNCFPKKA